MKTSHSEKNAFRQVDIRLRIEDAPPLYSDKPVTTPNDAFEVMKDLLSTVDREYFCVVNVDGSLKPINFNIVSVGGLCEAYVPVQNVFKSAILSNAKATMLFHSHPSGEVTPSHEDYEVTRRLVEVGGLMNIPVLDHLIIGGRTSNFFSFASEAPEYLKPEKYQTQDKVAEHEKLYIPPRHSR